MPHPKRREHPSQERYATRDFPEPVAEKSRPGNGRRTDPGSRRERDGNSWLGVHVRRKEVCHKCCERKMLFCFTTLLAWQKKVYVERTRCKNLFLQRCHNDVTAMSQERFSLITGHFTRCGPMWFGSPGARRCWLTILFSFPPLIVLFPFIRTPRSLLMQVASGMLMRVREGVAPVALPER